MPSKFELRDLLGEDEAENYLWTPRELEQLDTASLKIMVDENVLKDFIAEHKPDEYELKNFLIEEIIGGR